MAALAPPRRPAVLKEDLVKYMIEYQIRAAGLSHDQNLARQEALINAFGKWKPEEGLTVHAFVSNLANGGLCRAKTRL
jgi:hypothetical protein